MRACVGGGGGGGRGKGERERERESPCLCVCACVRAQDKQTETDRQTDRGGKEREIQKGGGGELAKDIHRQTKTEKIEQ